MMVYIPSLLRVVGWVSAAADYHWAGAFVVVVERAGRGRTTLTKQGIAAPS